MNRIPLVLRGVAYGFVVTLVIGAGMWVALLLLGNFGSPVFWLWFFLLLFLLLPPLAAGYAMWDLRISSRQEAFVLALAVLAVPCLGLLILQLFKMEVQLHNTYLMLGLDWLSLAITIGLPVVLAALVARLGARS